MMKKLQFLVILIVLPALCASFVTVAMLPGRQVVEAGVQKPLWVRPTSGAVGDWVRIATFDWVPNETLTVTFCNTVSLEMSDGYGRLLYNIQVPPSAVQGSTAVTVQDDQGNYAEADFTVGSFAVYKYGHLAIHYTKDSGDRDCVRDLRDLHDTDGNASPNGIPDCVDMIADELALCWQAEVDEFGYVAPTSAPWLNEYQVYILDVVNNYTAGGPGLDECDTHIVVSHDITDQDHMDWYYANPSQFDPKVVLAHELHHAIQWRYLEPAPAYAYFAPPSWIMEGSATWMGNEVARFYSNPIEPYVQNYVPHTYRGLDPDDWNSFFSYEGCLFFYFLADNLRVDFSGTGSKRDVVRRYWEEWATNGSLNNKQNFDNALSNAPSGCQSFDEAFMGFAKANYFHIDWYPQWPSNTEVATRVVSLGSDDYIELDSRYGDLSPLDHYGVEYFKIGAPAWHDVRITFTGEDPLAQFFLLVYPGGQEDRESSLFTTDGQGEVTIKGTSISANDVVIVGRLDDSLTNDQGHFRLQLSLLNANPAWDLNHDNKVDYKDLAILGAHYGQTTSPPYPAWDINQDGVINYKDLAILGAHYGESY